MKLKNLAFFGIMASILSVASAQAAEGDDYIASKGYVDRQVSSGVDTALADYSTTTEMNSAIATAKTEAINTAASDATTKAGTAEQNAKDYANTQASAAETAAKGYTDTEIGKLDSSATADTGKVLTGVTVVDGKITAKTDVALPTVDQTYDGTSTNAQSGTAVAQAIDGVSTNMTSHINNNDIHVTADQKTAWTNKQDAISDLETIRSGAAAGATALQSDSPLDGANLTAGTVAKTALATAVQNAIDGAVVANSSITPSSANSIVQYDAKGLVVSGTAAGELATATMTACPANKKCVVTKNSDNTYSYTVIQE